MRVRVLLVCLAFLGGCALAARQNADWDAAQESRFWPEAGAKARIGLLQVVTPQSVVGTEGSPRFLDWLTGQRATLMPLLTPYAVVADGEGKIWVADPESAVVHCFDLRRQSLDYWTSFNGTNLVSPVGLGIAPSHDQLYVADSELKKVFVVSVKGELRGELQPASGFQRPTGITVDARGRVYVADAVSGLVEVFSPSGEHLRSIGSGLDALLKFNVPIAVAVDGRGRLLVNDSMNFRIEVFDPQGFSVGAIGEIGDVPGTFARPRGVAVDTEDHVYVVDAAFGNVQIFSPAGELLLYFGAWGDAPGEFSLPAGLFIDQYDRIYVVDSYNHRVQVFQYLKGSSSR